MSMRSVASSLALFVFACSPQGSPAPEQTGSAAATLTPFPCDVGVALQTKCWGCHGQEKSYGATTTLLTYEDAHTMTRDGTQEIYQRMAKRIHDTSSPMPMRGFPALTAQELATLDAWIAQGAPPGNGCTSPSPGG